MDDDFYSNELTIRQVCENVMVEKNNKKYEKNNILLQIVIISGQNIQKYIYAAKV